MSTMSFSSKTNAKNQQQKVQSSCQVANQGGLGGVRLQLSSLLHLNGLGVGVVTPFLHISYIERRKNKSVSALNISATQIVQPEQAATLIITVVKSVLIK